MRGGSTCTIDRRTLEEAHQYILNSVPHERARVASLCLRSVTLDRLARPAGFGPCDPLVRSQVLMAPSCCFLMMFLERLLRMIVHPCSLVFNKVAQKSRT